MNRPLHDNIEEMEEEEADYVNISSRTGDKKVAARLKEMEEEAATKYVNAPARTGKKMTTRPEESDEDTQQQTGSQVLNPED
ncbi:hypothetical protein FQN60_011488 [Etheostoma spectabile]|uniref:Uncharacterized protein n=1 Tax=Etheostoma spectabile TaxID=54343 RepID=A0A5J5CB17_9PERO|nr:hypothetical protein FQN60_011488 [Etheostoma spectabile]